MPSCGFALASQDKAERGRIDALNTAAIQRIHTVAKQRPDFFQQIRNRFKGKVAAKPAKAGIPLDHARESAAIGLMEADGLDLAGLAGTLLPG